MRPTTVVILAGVCVVLLVLVGVDRSPMGESPAQALPVIDARPSQVLRIAVTAKADTTELVAGPRRWSVARAAMSWPADDRLVRAGLRLVTSAIATPAEVDVSTIATNCVIETTEGTFQLDIGGQSLSGQRPASLNGASVRIDESLADLLAPAALLAWMDQAVMPGISADARLIRIRSLGTTLELSRVGSRWGLTQPIRTPADPQRVVELIATLGQLQSTGALQAAHATDEVIELHAESASAAWTVRSDAQGVGTRSLRTETAGFEAPLQLDAAALEALRIDAASLIAPIVLDIPASDIARVSVDQIAFERQDRRWPISEIDALLDVVSNVPCSTITIGADQPSAEPLVRAVSFTRFGNLPAAELAVSVTDRSLSIRDGRVTRSYSRSEERVDAVAAWLSGVGD